MFETVKYWAFVNRSVHVRYLCRKHGSSGIKTSIPPKKRLILHAYLVSFPSYILQQDPISKLSVINNINNK